MKDAVEEEVEELDVSVTDVPVAPPPPRPGKLTLRHRRPEQPELEDCDDVRVLVGDRLDVMVGVVVKSLLPLLDVVELLEELVVVVRVNVEVTIVMPPPGRVTVPTDTLTQASPLHELVPEVTESVRVDVG
ncbi:MAG: hypothetical protein Q9166_003346 [cf. Caloplaca sp. 2 TL-2023]